jgi:hypothetical protein
MGGKSSGGSFSTSGKSFGGFIGVGGDDGSTYGGAGGCGANDLCSACEPHYFVIKCNSGEYRRDSWNSTWQAACTALQDEQGNQGGGGNVPVPSAAGVANLPDTCDSYSERGDTLGACVGSCLQTDHEFKYGSCAVNDECCVVLSRWRCAR